jgi:hypothetical protein
MCSFLVRLYGCRGWFLIAKCQPDQTGRECPMIILAGCAAVRGLFIKRSITFDDKEQEQLPLKTVIKKAIMLN